MIRSYHSCISDFLMNSSKDLPASSVSSIIDSSDSTDSLILIESSIDRTSFSHSSSSTNDSSSITLQSSCDVIYTAEKIKNLLLYQKQKYQIVKNSSSTTAQWWRAFGYPSQMDENNILRKIPGFISCLKCMHTMVHKHSTGTIRFKEHADKCFPLSKSSVSTSLDGEPSSVTQASLDQMGFNKPVKLAEKDVLKIKNLSAEWICGDLRPFSIVDDPGLRNLAQECIRLGKKNNT